MEATMTTQTTLGAQPPTPLDLWNKCKEIRGFLINLTRNGDEADDLISETWLSASKGLHTFEPESNLSAWLVTIARNLYLTRSRRLWRSVLIEDPEGKYAARLTFREEQEWYVIGQDIQAALNRLP